MRIFLLGLAAILASADAAAQAPQPAPPAAAAPDSDRLALGRRLAAAGDFNAIVGAMGAMEVERTVAEAPDLSDAERSRLREVGGRVFAAERERLLEAVAAIYARNFTADQMTAIVAFLESPAGRTYTGALPRLLPEIAAAMQGRDLAREIRAAFCRETNKLCEPAPN